MRGIILILFTRNMTIKLITDQLLYYKYYWESGSCTVLLTDLIVHDFLPAKLEVTSVSFTNPLKLWMVSWKTEGTK